MCEKISFLMIFIDDFVVAIVLINQWFFHKCFIFQPVFAMVWLWLA